jgi:hypothetical protein
MRGGVVDIQCLRLLPIAKGWQNRVKTRRQAHPAFIVGIALSSPWRMEICLAVSLPNWRTAVSQSKDRVKAVEFKKGDN